MALTQVKFAEPVYYNFKNLHTDTYLNNMWHLQNTGQKVGYTPGNDINILPAWEITYGDSNVIIVNIDQGIDLIHPDLVENILPRGDEDWDFTSGPGVEPNPIHVIDGGGAIL